MPTHEFSSFTKRHQGFTLVEIMIAIAISTILMLGVIQVFGISKHAYKLDNGLARAQETARYVVHTMAQEIRMAGYTGCRPNKVANTLNNYNQWQFNFDTPLQGWEGGVSTFPTDFDTKVVAGTDAIVILRGGGTQYKITKSNNNAATMTLQTTAGLSNGDIVVVSDCDQSSVFQINSNIASNQITHSTASGKVTPGNCTKGLASPVDHPCNTNGNYHDYGANGGLLKMIATAYYIGTSTDGTGNSLYRLSMDKGALATPEELADGVESMQIVYGVDTTGDGLANQYVKASDVTDFNKVVSVRLGLLVDSISDVASTANKSTYTIADTSITETGSDKKLRFPITTTIKLRNRGVM